jgi:hypothetical protein
VQVPSASFETQWRGSANSRASVPHTEGYGCKSHPRRLASRKCGCSSKSQSARFPSWRLRVRIPPSAILETWPCSSIQKSTGLRIRRLKVQILPGSSASPSFSGQTAKPPASEAGVSRCESGEKHAPPKRSERRARLLTARAWCNSRRRHPRRLHVSTRSSRPTSRVTTLR